MRITFSKQLVTIFAAAVISAGPQVLAWQVSQPPGSQVPGSQVPADQVPADQVPGRAGQAAGALPPDAVVSQAAVVRYWTPDRMAAALRQAAANRGTDSRGAGGSRQLVRRSPLAPAAPWLSGDTNGAGRRWTHAGAVAAATGKAFFTLGGEDYVCSGTLVGGRPDVVLTAAHCVSGGTGRDGGTPRLATNWMFAPGYDDGLLPYGEYTAQRFFVSKDWTGPAGGSEQYDVAFVRVTAAPEAPGTAQAPPGLPVQFAVTQDGPVPGRAYLFGYPAEPPYTGWYLSYCAGRVSVADGSARTPCGMTAGDSGGPWLAGFSPRSGSGTVVAVSTYKLSGDPRVLYGALLGPLARALYLQAVSTAR